MRLRPGLGWLRRGRPAQTLARLARRGRARLGRSLLRTRVLAGVLAITLIALVAFDLAAVTALRGYLIAQTDSQLRTVLGLYRLDGLPPFLFRGPQPSSAGFQTRKGAPVPRARVQQNVRVTGPHVALHVPALAQYFVAVVPLKRNGPPNGLVVGNPNLVPRLPGNLATLATGLGAETVPSRGSGQPPLRLLAVPAGGSTLVVTTSLGPVDSTVGRLQLIVIIGSAAAALFVAVGVALVMRRGLRTIETMAAEADRITAGDLTERVSAHDPRSEVGRLGAALNGMLTRIETTVHEREASQEATRRFFADASHELRNPLASLRANAELYEQGALPYRPQVDQAMHRIAVEAKRMSGLVDDMLRLARLDQHPEQHQDQVDLSRLVSECTERARITDPLRTWHTRIDPGLVTTGDEELLRRAVDNLLANVHAHTPEHTVATITASAHDGTVTIGVSDDGPGVPERDLPRIFDRFYRAATHARHAGSGLGLRRGRRTRAARAARGPPGRIGSGTGRRPASSPATSRHSAPASPGPMVPLITRTAVREPGRRPATSGGTCRSIILAAQPGRSLVAIAKEKTTGMLTTHRRGAVTLEFPGRGAWVTCSVRAVTAPGWLPLRNMPHAVTTHVGGVKSRPAAARMQVPGRPPAACIYRPVPAMSAQVRMGWGGCYDGTSYRDIPEFPVLIM